MINVYLEIERLKSTLRNRGLDEETVDTIAQKAEQEILSSLGNKMDAAIENAIQSGVQKDSPEFINDLRPRPDAFMLDTQSGATDFSDPPFPMLHRLLESGTKPMKDGSGVYKIIPVGGQSLKQKLDVHANIFDTQKAIMAERYKEAASQYNKVIPKGSKAVSFKTATSKQNSATQWVIPAKEKDFTEELGELNSMLAESHDDIVMSVIRSYEEGF